MVLLDTATPPRKFVVAIASGFVHRTDTTDSRCRAGFAFTNEGELRDNGNVGWSDSLAFLLGQGYMVCPICEPNEDASEEKEED